MVNVKSLPSSELERIIEDYPWFSAARYEYILRQGGDSHDKDAIRLAARRNGLFFLSRKELNFLIDRYLFGPVPEKEPVRPPVKPHKTYYAAGGDYFSKEDFQQLEQDGLAVEIPAFNKVPEPSQPVPATGEVSTEYSGAQDLYTETLAKVYADQEFYQRAIDIYEKLILLYPKKSAYFASLIEKIKNLN
ncbi:MAG: hypothetical protein KBT00_04950 [Bacteroidales bacterium]|nr:hypothetical protein [Candidatus Cacconaster merdequi]